MAMQERVLQSKRLHFSESRNFCGFNNVFARSNGKILAQRGAVMRKRRQHKNKKFLQAVGLAIRFFRLELCLSQEELGARCNVHRTYITEIESGVRNISLLTLANVATALEIRAWRLLHYEEGQEPDR